MGEALEAGTDSFGLTSPVGLIAGNGTFPLHFARNAKKEGLRVVAVAHRGETDPRLEDEVETCTWIRVGELGRMIRTFQQAGVKEVAMAGGITRIRLFGGLKPDLKALALMARLRSMKDDVVLRGIADEIERHGLEVISSSLLLGDFVPVAGVLTRRALSDQELKDARIGWEAARLIGAADIGQTVVMGRGAVVAVEAIEGTDATIKRAGEMAGAGCTVVKVSKPQQDLRFDLPTIGERTISVMKEAGVTALVLEEGRCLILEPELVVGNANDAGIAIEVFRNEEEVAQRLTSE